jgi:hypothetical protein
MTIPASVATGWRPLYEELEASLQRLDPSGELLDLSVDASGLPRFRVRLDRRVKAEGRALVREYERRAIELCERCGGPGQVHAGVILTTRCDHCL